MSEVFITKFLHKSDHNSGAMDSSFRIYMWIKYTLLMLFLQILWKIRQMTDYFNIRSDSIEEELSSYYMRPLTRESKKRRHIRSMSDVQNSTPHKRNYRKASYHPLMFDEDLKPRRMRSYQYRPMYSSDSSDEESLKTKARVERNIMKPTDSMRFL